MITRTLTLTADAAARGSFVLPYDCIIRSIFISVSDESDASVAIDQFPDAAQKDTDRSIALFRMKVGTATGDWTCSLTDLRVPFKKGQTVFLHNGGLNNLCSAQIVMEL